MVAAAVLLTSNVTLNDPHDRSPLRNIKPLGFTTATKWKKEVREAKSEDAIERKPLYPPSFPISQALDGILEQVSRDFVSSWYGKVSPDPSFSIQVEKLVRYTLERLLESVQKVDLPEVLVGKIAPLVSAHLHDFSAAERGVRGRRLDINLTESEELDLAIATKYRNGKLHDAAGLGFSDMKQAQQDHLRKVVDKVLPMLLPPSERKSKLVCTIAREIVACGILFPTLEMMSDPDWWNRIIEAIVGYLPPDWWGTC